MAVYADLSLAGNFHFFIAFWMHFFDLSSSSSAAKAISPTLPLSDISTETVSSLPSSSPCFFSSFSKQLVTGAAPADHSSSNSALVMPVILGGSHHHRISTTIRSPAIRSPTIRRASARAATCHSTKTRSAIATLSGGSLRIRGRFFLWPLSRRHVRCGPAPGAR